ncbi:MAG TPA: type VI secretion system baseplate subunit TssE [Steroidobacteraceae bacterium]|nr:type VI secretion system baseplate subunit TssE [Steroidobacteraceae bacterium]
MAELSLKERLQPALLDRLIDESRYITTFRLTIERAQLARLGIVVKDLLAILSSQGLRPDDDDPIPTASGEGPLTLTLLAASATVSPAQLKAFVIRPPGAPQGVTLQSFSQIESFTDINAKPESADKRMISMRRLRESVQRDLGWLLNSSSLDTTEDLTPFPEVTTSVINYGMPSFAGTALHSIDPQETARRIQEAIEAFEPRLSKVQVVTEGEGDKHDSMTLSFRIEGELWGQPMAQHVVLHTRIDVETGDVRLGESTGK